jgi:hypothetical protein
MPKNTLKNYSRGLDSMNCCTLVYHFLQGLGAAETELYGILEIKANENPGCRVLISWSVNIILSGKVEIFTRSFSPV